MYVFLSVLCAHQDAAHCHPFPFLLFELERPESTMLPKLPPALICCEESLCLLATRCSVKLLVMIFVIVGVAAAQLVVDIDGSVTTTMTLTTFTVEAGGMTISGSLSDYIDSLGGDECGDALLAMFNAALAMGIICILCTAAGIGLSVANKFLAGKLPLPGGNIPPVVFVALAAMEMVTALTGFALIASALNGGACDTIKMSDIPEGKYGAGFVMYIIGWIISIGDLVVEVLVLLGVVGGGSASSQIESPMMDAVVQSNGYRSGHRGDFDGL